MSDFHINIVQLFSFLLSFANVKRETRKIFPSSRRKTFSHLLLRSLSRLSFSIHTTTKKRNNIVCTHSPYDEKHISCLTACHGLVFSPLCFQFYRLCVQAVHLCREGKKKNRVFPFSYEASHVISFQTYVDSMIVNMNFKLIFSEKIIFAFHAIFNFSVVDATGF